MSTYKITALTGFQAVEAQAVFDMLSPVWQHQTKVSKTTVVFDTQDALATYLDATLALLNELAIRKASARDRSTRSTIAGRVVALHSVKRKLMKVMGL